MKILNVVTHIDPVTGGGCAERTRQMSRYLARCGEEVTLLTTDLGITDECRKALPGVEVVALPAFMKRFYFPVLQLNRIKKAVAEADMIHLMGHWSVLNTLVYLFLKQQKKPYVVCPAGALPICGRSKVLKAIYNSLIGRRIIQEAAADILVTAGELPSCQDYGIETDKILVIPNGIDPDEPNHIDVAAFREKSGLGPTPFILFMGRLNHLKGPDLLLRAFCEAMDELPGCHLAVAGPDDGMGQEMEDITNSYGAKTRVHFLGYLENPAKTEAYQAAQLVVIPSRQEAMSIVVLEAGICGTPVLLTDQCGFNEVAAVDGGEVVPASVPGIKAGLLRMLENPQKLAAQGANLKRFVEENYRWDALVFKYIELYRKILLRRAA
ncbi:MAG: glycosyltransferase [Syntrophobacterales bacterium]|jgi:glycosyltransferase involved in cell wall biosynthesis|nr:glycosyltransferase [Syntrophobacterales bacterium]